jgi:ABC-type antimicrobial peptide transport system permease subunit
LIAAGIGLLSAFIPAYQASRISILEALRSTD